MGAPIRIGVVEDHRGTREAMLRNLERAGAQVAVALAVDSAEAFLASPLLPTLDVALIDVQLPGMSGAETIRHLAQSSPKLRSIALTVFDDAETFLEVIQAGAFGYLVKSDPFERLLLALEEAASGQHPLSSRVAGHLIAQTRRQAVSPLTDREEEIAVALAGGLSYAECARSLGIALGTVQHHVKGIYRKLDVSSKREVRNWVERNAGAR